MAKIIEILGATDYKTYCIVEVMLDNQEIAQVYVGGSVEAYIDNKNGIYKAFVKKAKEA
jgi:hypothetical protein